MNILREERAPESDLIDSLREWHRIDEMADL